MTADQFNHRYSVGTACRYFPIKGDATYVDSRTRSEAWALGSGHVVVKIDGKAGGVLIEHLQIEISP